MIHTTPQKPSYTSMFDVYLMFHGGASHSVNTLLFLYYSTYMSIYVQYKTLHILHTDTRVKHSAIPLLPS